MLNFSHFSLPKSPNCNRPYQGDFIRLDLSDLTSFAEQHIFPENSVQTSKILWRSVLDAFFLAQEQENNFTLFQKISCESNFSYTTRVFRGRDKRAYIAAQRQAKFYPPQQAAAAADRALQLPQCTSRNA